MNQVVSNLDDIVIDSPQPEIAHMEAKRYYDWLLKAFQRSGVMIDRDEWAADILSGDVLLVRVWKDKKFTALAACRVLATHEGNELYVMAAAGVEWKSWLHPIMETFEQLALEAKCVAVVLDGRKGWHGALRGEGYKLLQVTMRKEVHYEH